MRLETIHPKDMGPAEIARWRALQHANENLQSPYLTPEWAQVIGATRDDARVCVIDGGAGFFGAQRLSRFTAMGIGAPIADHHGVVGEDGSVVDAGALCRALKVGRIDLTHVPKGQTILGGAAAGEDGSWVAEVSGGRELYEAALKQRRSEFVRQTDKKARKIARDHGHVEFRANAAEYADFETLLTWKNDQLERSHQPRIWAAPWVRQTLETTWAARGDTNLSGVLFTLSIEQKLIAAAYALRSGGMLHFWIVAHDNAFDSYSPGVQLARWACCWAGENGFAAVEFGPGDYQYKRQLATTQRMLERGVVAGLSLSGAVRRAEHAVRAGMERLPQPKLAALPGKAMRRIDLMRALATA